VLPPDIRVLAFKPVPDDFDARFNCLRRVYKYFFVPFGMDLALMNQAAQHFVGEHDFRNFCKLDENVQHFTRRITSIVIEPCDANTAVATFTGTAFLWHQIRCMVSVLMLVGRGLEQPSVIADLLDVDKHPQKPQYELADPAGLVLFDCFFEGRPADREGLVSVRLPWPTSDTPAWHSSCPARHSF